MLANGPTAWTQAGCPGCIPECQAGVNDFTMCEALNSQCKEVVNSRLTVSNIRKALESKYWWALTLNSR